MNKDINPVELQEDELDVALGGDVILIPVLGSSRGDVKNGHPMGEKKRDSGIASMGIGESCGI